MRKPLLLALLVLPLLASCGFTPRVLYGGEVVPAPVRYVPITPPSGPVLPPIPFPKP